LSIFKMASDHMRKMLDELMGTQRDGASDMDAVKFTSPNVCKSYLLGLCPYDLFHNTKLDLGACSRIHDPALKADYELAIATDKSKNYDYEIEQLDELQQFIGDCDRKVSVNKRRLEETQDAESLGPEALAVHELNEQIGIKLAEAEELGADGKVDESMAIMQEIEDLKTNKRKAEDIYRNSVLPTTNQQQKLRVCEICAAFLSLYDNDRRLADHFGGRLHMGFIKVRERLQELEDQITKKREQREQEREKRRQERDGGYSRSFDHDRDRDRDRRRDRSRDRDYRRDRSRDRSRDRHDRERSRHRDRDRDRRRSRSRDRDSRRRHKSRDRSRSRDKESRRSSTERDRSRECTSKDGTPERTSDVKTQQIREERLPIEAKQLDEPQEDGMEEGEVNDIDDTHVDFSGKCGHNGDVSDGNSLGECTAFNSDTQSDKSSKAGSDAS